MWGCWPQPPAGFPALLDVCCGPGRHAGALAARGYRVTGVDANAGAIMPYFALNYLRVKSLPLIPPSGWDQNPNQNGCEPHAGIHWTAVLLLSWPVLLLLLGGALAPWALNRVRHT